MGQVAANPDPSDSSEWPRRIIAGDEDAAAAIFHRYLERLTRLARSRLAKKLAARVDPEDIVMSAYRSFFSGMQQGRFAIESGGDLWRLLVEVTLHKLYHAVDRHMAQRRSVEREAGSFALSAFATHHAGSEPTPEEALAATEELEAILQQLSQRGRQILELRLQGYELEEIADRLDCNERTVRRHINEARLLMAARGGSDFVPTTARISHRSPAILAGAKTRTPLVPLTAPLNWNDYLLEAQIGAGATGKVYRALYKQTGENVAVKFLRKSLTGNASATHRFLQEAKTVAALAHPGIVPVHGPGQTPGGGLFLVMELIRGTDLEKVRRENSVSLLEAISWTAEAARVIQFAHQHGVIHCDLKPSNLLIDHQRKIRVTDFGLAVRHEELEAGFGSLAGTPAFMAPEQVDPCWGAVSPRTDVWGLGGVLYFLIFGHGHCTAADVPGALASVVSQAPVSFPATEDPRLGDVLSILRQCLNKKPSDRLPSALALADRLTAAAASLR